MKLKHLIVGIILNLLFINVVNAQDWFTTGQNANLMLSGVDFNNSGGPLQFNHPSGIASDGIHFLLCDRFNNRVLIWNSLPDQWNDEPDLVLGQPNFTFNNSGIARNQLNFPGNVSVSENGLVAVADTQNDRILIWLQFPTQNGQLADVSLSLPVFTPSGSNMHLSWPWGVWTDGQKLIAVATRGKTILFWNSIPAYDDQPPDYTISLPHMGTPRNISTDGETYLFIGDHNASVPGYQPSGTFFWNSFPTQNNQSYDFFRNEWIKGIKLPDDRLIAGGMNALYIWNTIPTTANQNPNLIIQNPNYRNGDGPDVVYAGGRLYACNYNGNNVQVYYDIPTQHNQWPDFALSSPSVDHNTLDDMNYIQNPVLTTDGGHLIATSDFDNEVWIWNTLNPVSGQAPDVRIELFNMGSNGDIFPWDNTVHNNQLVTVGGHSLAIWNQIPLDGSGPTYIIRNQIGGVLLNQSRGIALDEHFFYLANNDGHIYVWDSLPVIGVEQPIRTITLPAGYQPGRLNSDGNYLGFGVIGQEHYVYIYRISDIAAGGNIQPYKIINRSTIPLNQPGEVLPFNGSLAVSNTGGNAVFLWQHIEDAGNPNNVIVLGQSLLQNNSPAIGIDRLFMPASLLAVNNSLWVGEFKFSSRILRFQPQEHPILPGDIDMDFQLSEQDIILLVNALLGAEPLSPDQLQLADLNDNTQPDIHDLIQLVEMVNRAYLLVNDFIPPMGSGNGPGPANFRLMVATSMDGLNFQRTGRIITDQGAVPDLVIDHLGWLYLYYTGWTVGNDINKTVVAISPNNGQTWFFKRLVLTGFEQQSEPVDPDIQILENGTFRLYLTSAPYGQPPRSYVAESNDGIHFTRTGQAFFSGNDTLDPSSLLIGNTWHIFAGGLTNLPEANFHGTSTDGQSYTFDGEMRFVAPNGLPIMMANGIAVPGGYRFYGFNTGQQQLEPGVYSVFTSDGVTWIPDNAACLISDPTNPQENLGVVDPAVVRLRDGGYFMVYAVGIP